MFLDQYNVFEQIGIVVAILLASLLFCVILQTLSILYYACLPFMLCFKCACKCKCRDDEDDETMFEDFSLRCPCRQDDDFKF
jgi:hypothetical protein